ncbi:MAG: archease [Pseudomonadota bacterium]|nr:archease [Pseudomonadota bacterium]
METRTGSGPAHWEHLHHDADIGLRGCGASLAEAFEQAALALTAVVCHPQRVLCVDRVDIHCESPDPETLFVKWLNALIYESATRKVLFGRFRVTITEGTLDARAWGEPIDRDRHQPAAEPKGATYTGLRVEHAAGGCWTAECVIDV